MTIIGPCPYDDCGGLLPLVEPPSDPPRVGYLRGECETCGRAYWRRLSRWDPWSMTERAFLAEHAVDEESKEIVP